MYPQRGGRCRPTGPQRRRSTGRSRDTGFAAVPGGHTAGWALTSRSRRGRRRQQPLPLPRPNHPSDTTPPPHNMSAAAAAAARTRAGAWKRLGIESGTRETALGGRRGRLDRTQIVEAETAATLVPQEAREGLREASPDTLCATGSLSSRPPPFPIKFRK